jgi:hypothetical protein
MSTVNGVGGSTAIAMVDSRSDDKPNANGSGPSGAYEGNGAKVERAIDEMNVRNGLSRTYEAKPLGQVINGEVKNQGEQIMTPASPGGSR